MEKLQTVKLYGNGLVEIDSAELVSRYNDCLLTLGLTQTRLDRFRIDGVGWSPEIAADQGTQYYLSHGDPAPLAIILTPDQQNKPVYMPFYSYQRQLMREYWSRFGREIADITSRAGLCVELDHGLSQYRSPLDLLLVRDVTVRTTMSGNLLATFNEQRALISEFNTHDDSWFNEELRNAIISSAKAHGDLRAHHFMVPEWTYSQTDFFRTSAFGGLFILRGLQKYKQLLIHENPDLDVPDESAHTGVFSISDVQWLKLLLSEGVIQVNTENTARLRQDVQRIRECLLADAAAAHDPDVDFNTMTSAQRKGLVTRLGSRLSGVYFELERLELRLDESEPLKANNLPVEVQYLLCQPAPALSHDKRKVICQLLSRYRPTDIWRLYRHNKHCFYEQYATWPEPKQQWAICLISHHLDNELTD